LNRTVEVGRTLLVDGPASVIVTSGKVEVFGFQVIGTRRIVVREGKRLPFTATETANFHIALGANASVKEVEVDTIPSSWARALVSIRENPKKPVIALVVGNVDSGKTSFCTYLTNKLIREKCSVAILDEDVGQSDIGPPGTVAYAYVANSFIDMFNLKAENAFFVGATSPSGAPDKAVEGCAFLKAEILTKRTVDFIVVNTDGWVEGEEALRFKTRLALALEPDVVFFLQRQDELAPLSSALGDLHQEQVESPAAIMERSREKRKSLRELSYAKYFENATVKIFPINRLTVEGGTLQLKKIQEKTLIGLYGKNSEFLGLGILRDIDFSRKALKVFTSVTTFPSVLVFGKVRLDKNLNEVTEQAQTSNV
jgi:polynucleotide 5'-hydroxyl-kinase GRC3/NOL9